MCMPGNPVIYECHHLRNIRLSLTDRMSLSLTNVKQTKIKVNHKSVGDLGEHLICQVM